MTDPTFTTREALEAWLKEQIGDFNRCLAFGYPHRTVERKIKCVILAHAHLLTPSKGTPA